MLYTRLLAQKRPFYIGGVFHFFKHPRSKRTGEYLYLTLNHYYRTLLPHHTYSTQLHPIHTPPYPLKTQQTLYLSHFYSFSPAANNWNNIHKFHKDHLHFFHVWWWFFLFLSPFPSYPTLFISVYPDKIILISNSKMLIIVTTLHPAKTILQPLNHHKMRWFSVL